MRIIANGGAGRLHYQGFPTSNHYGATADGLVLAYRAGARLLYQDTLQYHPTGVAFPSQIYGALVTEKVRSMGAQFVNVDGEAFMHPLETRDVAASGVIREVARGNGIHTPLRDGIWLDSPMIDAIHGEGTLEKRLPGMLRMYLRYLIGMNACCLTLLLEAVNMLQCQIRQCNVLKLLTCFLTCVTTEYNKIKAKKPGRPSGFFEHNEKISNSNKNGGRLWDI